MKILLLTWACDRDDVSEPEIAYRWVREISKRHEVVLFSVSRPDRYGCVREQFPDLEVIEWCDIRVPAALERFRAVAKPGYFLYFSKARKFLRDLVRQHKFDIIHHLNPFAWRYASPAYGLGVPLVRGPLAGGLPTPTPFLSEVRETFHPYKFLRFSDKWRKKFDRTLIASYQQTDCLLVAAPYVLDLLKPLPIQKYEIEIEHGLEHISNVSRFSSIDKKIIILFVGRIIRTKGLREAIKSIYYLRNRENVEFRIVGDGEDFVYCKELVNELNISNVVSFVGWCSKEKTKKEFSNADIFLFPSFREPTGGVILEAMTQGLPCVVCNYGGPVYMMSSECGILVPPANSDEYSKNIAMHIDTLVDNPVLRIRLGDNARRYSHSKFSWSEKMNRLDCYYKQLVK